METYVQLPSGIYHWQNKLDAWMSEASWLFESNMVEMAIELFMHINVPKHFKMNKLMSCLVVQSKGTNDLLLNSILDMLQ